MNNPLPTLNVQLLADVVTWAVADEKALTDLQAKYPDWGVWNQGTWATQVRNGICQTSYCIAGQAATQVGYGLCVPLYDDPATWEHTGYDFTGYDDEYIKRELSEVNANHCAPKVFAGLDDHGRPKYRLDYTEERAIPDVAREALGLEPNESSALFEGGNNIATVVTIAFMVAKARGPQVEAAFLEAVPDAVINVMEEEWSGDWTKGYTFITNRFYFPDDYVNLVVPPTDATNLLTTLLEEAFEGGRIGERDYEHARSHIA